MQRVDKFAKQIVARFECEGSRKVNQGELPIEADRVE